MMESRTGTLSKGTLKTTPGVDYGTLQEDYTVPQGGAGGFIYKPEEQTPQTAARVQGQLKPWLKLLMTALATLLVVAVFVILAVYGLSLQDGDGNQSQVASNLTDRERVMAILSRVPLIDGHNGLADVAGDRQTDIGRMRQGMLGAQFWTANVHCRTQQTDAIRVMLQEVDVIKRFVAQYNDTFTLVTTSQGIMDTFESGKIASLIGIEGGHSIDSSLATLRMFYELGVRYMGLTQNCNTPWADSVATAASDQIPSHGGLTEFGKIVVKEMNRLGMMVDLSHAAYDTIVDALNVTTAPVIVSHSAAWSLCNYTLNFDDSKLQLVRQNHGIFMVDFTAASLDCTETQVSAPTMSSVADHIEYVHRVAGSNHVGLGATFDSFNIGTVHQTGLQDVSEYPELFAELASKGWTDEDLEKLAGRNILRVFSAVEEERDRLSAVMGPFEDLVPEDDVRDLPCRSDL